MEEALNFETTVLCSSMDSSLAFLCVVSLQFERVKTSSGQFSFLFSFPSFMPVVTFIKSNEDTLVGWLHRSCQLCPDARTAGFGAQGGLPSGSRAKIP